MKFLLDTHAALWWWLDAPQLSETAQQKMADPDNAIYFSDGFFDAVPVTRIW